MPGEDTNSQAGRLGEPHDGGAATTTENKARLGDTDPVDRGSGVGLSARDYGSRVGELERRVEVDRALIAELRAEGLLSREHAENLEVALRSSRTIGAAIGIVMSHRNLSEHDAFEVLRQASMNNNRKLRDLANEVVLTGDVGLLQAG